MFTLASDIHSVNSLQFRVLTALLRNGKLVLPSANPGTRTLIARGEPGPQLGEVLHSQLTLESLGFIYDQAAILTLSWLPHAEVCIVHQNIEAMLRRALGAHLVYRPMYPNFPEQVLLASDKELLVNAWLHYLGDWLGVRILPNYTEARRTPLKSLENSKPTQLALAEDKALVDLLARLLNSNASLSPANKEVVVDLVDYFSQAFPGHLIQVLGRVTIPQKEIRALLGGCLLKVAPSLFDLAEIALLFTTPTDVLRLAAAASAPDLKTVDLSLAAAPRFGKMSRATRRTLLAMLDVIESPSALAEMFQRREMWVRLGEQLHPGEYHTRFATAQGYFKALRDNLKPASWNGALEHLLKKHDTAKTVALLAQRPGVFARKLHELLRKSHELQHDDILAQFWAVIQQVSTPVLVQLRHRMKNDLARLGVQAFKPKAGSTMWVPTKAVEPLNAATAQGVVDLVTRTLRSRFAGLPALGKVYIDPALQGYTVPFSQRSAQKALRTVGRGSRIAMGDERIIRAFLWWNESGVDTAGEPYRIERTDLDLSCAVFDSSFNYVDHCSFTRLRSAGLTHSGDITSAPNGACEFIDINFDALPKKAAYIALVTYSYTRQNFADLPEAHLGWMARPDGQSGEIYDPRTVREKVDLTASGERVLMGFIDVARREFVWADLVLPASRSAMNAVESSTLMTGVLARGLVNPVRPTLFDLAADHAAARGTLVENEADADLVFTSKMNAGTAVQKTVSAYDAEVILSEFLA